MGYRRLFIMRKDLNMSAGKLAAQVAHCAEEYWLHMFRNNVHNFDNKTKEVLCYVDNNVFDEYINGDIVKTICEAKNKTQLLKAKTMAEELGFIENVDFGLIYDKCYTELQPEEPNGTTLTGIWFKPMEDEIAHQISKKYHLYV